jgi:hypothetical protein
MVGSAFRFTGAEIGGAHLVEQEKRVQHVELLRRKGAVDEEACSLEGRDGIDDSVGLAAAHDLSRLLRWNDRHSSATRRSTVVIFMPGCSRIRAGAKFSTAPMPASAIRS